MSIVKRSSLNIPRYIDLSGPHGNAHYLLAYAQSLAKQCDLDADAILSEMKSGDYNNLIEVFDKHFGSIVTLAMPDDEEEQE